MKEKTLSLRGLKKYRHPRTGILYIYHRETGKRLLSEPGTPEFFREYASIVSRKKQKKSVPGTLGELIEDYKTTFAWKKLSQRTKEDYQKTFDFLSPIHDAPLVKFNSAQIARLRDRWAEDRGARFVNYCLTALSVILARGVEIGAVGENYAAKVSHLPRLQSRPNRPWNKREIRAVWLATATQKYAHMRLPFALALYTGMREGDILNLKWENVAGNKIVVETKKRGVKISLPIANQLARLLKYEKTGVVCLNSRGKPWSQSGFLSSWRKMLFDLRERSLIGDGLTFHGLRHTVATHLAECGASERDIAAVLGQRSSRMAAHYSEFADRSARTAELVGKLVYQNQEKCLPRKERPNKSLK